MRRNLREMTDMAASREIRRLRCRFAGRREMTWRLRCRYSWRLPQGGFRFASARRRVQGRRGRVRDSHYARAAPHPVLPPLTAGEGTGIHRSPVYLVTSRTLREWLGRRVRPFPCGSGGCSCASVRSHHLGSLPGGRTGWGQAPGPYSDPAEGHHVGAKRRPPCDGLPAEANAKAAM
jgi:hypothetical protein